MNLEHIAAEEVGVTDGEPGLGEVRELGGHGLAWERVWTKE